MINIITWGIRKRKFVQVALDLRMLHDLSALLVVELVVLWLHVPLDGLGLIVLNLWASLEAFLCFGMTQEFPSLHFFIILRLFIFTYSIWLFLWPIRGQFSPLLLHSLLQSLFSNSPILRNRT